MRDDIQTAAEEDRVITGANETVKHANELTQIVVAANTPQDLRERIEEAAAEYDVPVDKIDANNRELGSLCMEPYTASVVGIK